MTVSIVSRSCALFPRLSRAAPFPQKGGLLTHVALTLGSRAGGEGQHVPCVPCGVNAIYIWFELPNISLTRDHWLESRFVFLSL